MSRKICIVDIDDTILATREVYGPVREKIFTIFSDIGLDKYAYAEPFTNTNECIGLYPMFKQLNAPAKAVGNTDLTIFPNVFVTMYKLLLHRKKGIVGPVQEPLTENEELLAKHIYDIAYTVYTTPPPIVDGAVNFLRWIRNEGWEIIYYSMGNQEVQKNRIYEQTNLGWFAHQVHIVNQKTTERFKKFIDYDIGSIFDSGLVEFMYIGDSPLDSIPALEYNIPCYIRRTEYHPITDFPDAHRIKFFDEFWQLETLVPWNPVEVVEGMVSLCSK